MKNRDQAGYIRELAYDNIQNAADQYIGELENCLADYPPEYEAYQSAEKELANHTSLVNTIYNMAITGYYKPGMSNTGPRGQMLSRQFRFCGKDWLMECTEDIVTNMGY